MVPASHRELLHILLKIYHFYFSCENYADAFGDGGGDNEEDDNDEDDDDAFADDCDYDHDNEDDNEDDDEDDIHPSVSLHLTELPLLRFLSLPSPLTLHYDVEWR